MSEHTLKVTLTCDFDPLCEAMRAASNQVAVAFGLPDPNPWPRFGLFWPWTRRRG